jgi:DNA-binding NarL/FixJ family response regulator
LRLEFPQALVGEKNHEISVGPIVDDGQDSAAPTVPSLSEHELRVLKEVAAGLSNKQIARRLGISPSTVRNHLSRVFNKLGVSNRTGAVLKAIGRGVLSI